MMTEGGTTGNASSLCEQCGAVGSQLCTKCRTATYCGRDCQRRAWVEGHKHRCPFRSKQATAEKQFARGEIELALQTLEEVSKTIAMDIKTESEKELDMFDFSKTTAHMRAFMCSVVVIEDMLGDERVSDASFCRAAFKLTATFLDCCAALKEGRRPSVFEPHLDTMCSVLQKQTDPDADPVLSTWMLYDGYAKGLEDCLSKYFKKLKQLRVAAVMALRDMLAACYDFLGQKGSCQYDIALAGRVDGMLDKDRLQVGSKDMKHLRPYFGGAHGEVKAARQLPHSRKHETPPSSDEDHVAMKEWAARKERRAKKERDRSPPPDPQTWAVREDDFSAAQPRTEAAVANASNPVTAHSGYVTPKTSINKDTVVEDELSPEKFASQAAEHFYIGDNTFDEMD